MRTSKKLKFKIPILFLLTTLSANAQIKRVCLTIDDLPTVTYSATTDKMALTNKLVSYLHKEKIPAIGFVNEIQLYKDNELDSTAVTLLDRWYAQGLDLGNHTFSHVSYHNVSFETFTADLLLGDKVTAHLAKKYDKTVRYFRHPYLHAGKTKEDTRALQQFLKDHHYIEAPVTLDNQDYQFARKYDRACASGDKKMQDSVGVAYLKYTEDAIAYYEELSKALFGKQLDHIFLMHANKLNADYMPLVCELLKSKGYSFIELEEALKDKSYQEPIKKFGPWGISWLERWALSRGLDKSLLEKDPEVPKLVIE